MKKIILFELNEVPLFIIDAYVNQHPQSTMAQLVRSSAQYETFTEDDGDLSPWITWPTLHRGVANRCHGISDLNQDLSGTDAAYPPLWQILTKHKIKTAVFGSLHSYPMPKDPMEYNFYLPDTFAEESEAYPQDLSIFQEFNLRMTRRSARNVSNKIAWSNAFNMLKALPKLGIKTRTVNALVAQLGLEKWNPSRLNRRRTFQAVLAFDVFYKKLQTYQPDFVTFFTNHVASAMHRYWVAAFPEHYSENNYSQKWLNTYKNEISFAMHKANAMLSSLKVFVDNNHDYRLLIASSMGQQAVNALPVETQLYLKHPDKLFSYFGIHSNEWQLKSAMFPQVNIKFKTESSLARFKSAISGLKIADQPIRSREQAQGFISIDLGHENLHHSAGRISLYDTVVDMKDLGFDYLEITDKSCTSAYHIPNGSLLIYPKLAQNSSLSLRPQISTCAIAPSILRNFNLPVPSYMKNDDILR